MTAYELFCNFTKSNAKATELENIAKKIKSLNSSTYKEELSNVENYWHGEAADVYMQKAVEISEEMDNIAASLLETADLIKRTAARVYEAEMKALDIAKNRTYN